MPGQQQLQDIAGVEKGIDHVRAQGQFTLADPVEQVFEDMGDFSQVGKAEGAGGTLDRMCRAKDGVELLGIGVMDVQFEQQGFHAVQMLLSLLEEHLVELAHVNRHVAPAHGQT